MYGPGAANINHGVSELSDLSHPSSKAPRPLCAHAGCPVVGLERQYASAPLYCIDHYKHLFGASCSACGQIAIHGSMADGDTRFYHREHFCCTQSHAPLRPGTQMALIEGQPCSLSSANSLPTAVRYSRVRICTVKTMDDFFLPVWTLNPKKHIYKRYPKDVRAQIFTLVLVGYRRLELRNVLSIIVAFVAEEERSYWRSLA